MEENTTVLNGRSVGFCHKNNYHCIITKGGTGRTKKTPKLQHFRDIYLVKYYQDNRTENCIPKK